MQALRRPAAAIRAPTTQTTTEGESIMTEQPTETTYNLAEARRLLNDIHALLQPMRTGDPADINFDHIDSIAVLLYELEDVVVDGDPQYKAEYAQWLADHAEDLAPTP
jgi:hypothetical protein